MTSTSTRNLTALLGALLLAGCGTQGSPGADPSSGTGPGSDTGTGTASASSTSGASLLVGQATILQMDDTDPVLCLGGVMESYPPQCGGPSLVGLDWADIADKETASGVTWGTGYVVGTFDGEAFTLTEPVSSDPPQGYTPPTQTPSSYPALCEDPYRGGDESFDPTSPEGMEAQNALAAATPALDGYVGTYVSDGADDYNVMVSGDPEQAHAALREVWPGWLCVAQRDLPEEAAVLAAQQALGQDAYDDWGVLGSGAGGADGLLDVQVMVADQATVAAILEAVAPWLTPAQVQISAALVPLER